MPTYEQSDGFIPNKQTPPSTAALGTSSDLWDEVNATAVSGTTVNAGALTLLNFNVPKYYSATVDFVVDTAKTVTHGLNNSNPLVMLYGSGTNRVIPMGSGNAGDVAVIVSASGATANTYVLTLNANAPGSTIVVIG